MGPTGNLIVGHTTERSTRIWVRGDARHPAVRIRVCPEIKRGVAEPRVEGRARLARGNDYTAVVSLGPLEPARAYRVVAEFAASDGDLERGKALVSAQGGFRTFPPPGDLAPFSFLHGSCNLSVVTLTNLGSLLLGALGWLAATESLKRPAPRPWRFVLRAGEMLASAVFWLVHKLTGYKQPRPMLPSPFRALRDRLDTKLPAAERPAFMIHAGDQIYFDVPDPGREPTRSAYRLAYREGFLGDETQRELLASCPHYMTLDDHELVDAFALDHVAASAGGWRPEQYLAEAVPAYREWVHARQPGRSDGPLWYEFEYGASRFLVLDTRTERHRGRREMLDRAQLEHLEGWLRQHKGALKFVVSSVPFLAELRVPVPKPGAPPGKDERDDKWTGRFFREQRDQLLELVHAERIGRLVFLVGDMHCSYHATMRLGTPERRTTLHELAGGPIHQLEFAPRRAFHDDFRGVTRSAKLPFRTWMRAFHGAAAGVLEVTVHPGKPALLWSVVRTHGTAEGASEARPLCGRIDLREDPPCPSLPGTSTRS